MGSKNEILNELEAQGANVPSEKLIKFFDDAVNGQLIDKAAAANDIGVQNVRALDNMFNDFTARQKQYECALSPQANEKPELLGSVKQRLVEQLKQAYTV
ncbi:MAG: hypothetical protein NZ828_07690 [Alphaproteobacteria bacterium]|nr:hypothetical protein [Alphaproteobacteria bacterium]